MLEQEIDPAVADELLNEMQALEVVFGPRNFNAAILSFVTVFLATHPVEKRVEILMRLGERSDLIAKNIAGVK